MPQPSLITHFVIILRERKPPPGATRVTRRPSVPGPQALQACPNTQSVQPDRAWHRLNVHIVWGCPLPRLHPSSSGGSSLAREAVEGKLETLQGSCMRWPGCLPWTIHCCSTKLHPGRASYCEHFPPGEREARESEITALVHTAVWKLGSGCAGTLARRELNRLSSSRRQRRGKLEAEHRG